MKANKFKFEVLSICWLWLLANILTWGVFATLRPSSASSVLQVIQANPHYITVLALTCALVVLEAVIFTAAIIAIPLFAQSKFKRRFLLVATWTVATFYLVFWCFSWAFYYRYNIMPSILDSWALTYLSDKVTISEYISFNDLGIFFIAILGGGLIVWYEIQRYSAFAKIAGILSPLRSLGVVALVLALVCIASLRWKLSSIEFKGSFDFLANLTIPQGSLFVDTFLPSTRKTYQKIALKLDEATPYSLSGVPPPNKNVLIIAVEAMRYDSFMAQDHDGAVMPNLRDFSRAGISFTRSYSQATDTEYSLNTIISGLYPLKFTGRDLGQTSDYPVLRLSQAFKDFGYRTAYLAVFDWLGMRRNASDSSFDLSSDPTSDGGAQKIEEELLAERARRGAVAKVDRQETIGRLDGENVRRFLEWLDQDEKTPFFGLMYMYGPHFPYNVPSPDYTPTSAKDLTYYFPNSEAEQYRAKYYKALRNVDLIFKSLIEGLEKRGRLNNTLLIVTGDHGEEFYEHGGCLHVGQLHEETTHVPLIMWGLPSSCLANQDQLSGHVDIAPTVLSALGLPPYGGYQGIDLCDVTQKSRTIFMTSQNISEEDGLISGKYKFVRNFKGRGQRLFDLEADPREQVDLSTNEPVKVGYFAEVLQLYRNQQLSYYLLPPEEQSRKFPPQPPQVAVNEEWFF